MPGKIKVKVLAGRNLPVMDRSSDTTDAYVEIKFGNTTYKTDVCRKSLNPQWNSEWYKFEVEDAELQDEPLQIRLMDHDTYSANDAIGKVYINLNPLLLPGVPPPVKNIWTLEASINSSTGAQGGLIMTGWLPVYDTMHGIRGEVNIIVKVELFLDFNKFRQSSCGVTFFYSPIVPHGYHAQVIHGFVEELVIGDDPEYKWIDKLRTPRASNEARQTLFLKLSNEVQRKIGLKALDLGGNAVIGYLQNFDLEGESGIVARGIGTVVTLVKLHDFQNFVAEQTVEDYVASKPNKQHSSDCSESDSSPRLILRQPNFPRPSDPNPLASSPTTLGSKFPLYGENVPSQPKTPLKFVDVKPIVPRQTSIQSYHSHTRNPLFSGSSLSLTEDVMDDSLKMMLALEDMRGESQGNRLTRGLRNLRHLPQRVLRSRNVDSLDEESDLDNVSIHSSTWSIVTSDTASIADVHGGSFKRKKFKKKSQGEGIMAAMLIRSVHASGLPLDSVKEDRETPTPSPVNFIDPPSTTERQPKNSSPAVITELPELPEPPNDEPQRDQPTNKTLLVTYSKLKVSTSEEDNIAPLTTIPMISSSESDTSSHDGDRDGYEEEDLPSESSTNYNILDDTQSLLDPSSPEAEPNCLLPFSFESQMMMKTTTMTEVKKDEEEDEIGLLDEKIDETYMLFVNKEEGKGEESDNLIENKDEDVVEKDEDGENELLIEDEEEQVFNLIVEDEGNDYVDVGKDQDAIDPSYSLFVNKEEDGKSINESDELIDNKTEDVFNLIEEEVNYSLFVNKDENVKSINETNPFINDKAGVMFNVIVEDEENEIDLDEGKDEDIVDQSYSLFVNKDEDGKSINESDQLIDNKTEDVFNLVEDEPNVVEQSYSLFANKDEIDKSIDDSNPFINNKAREAFNLIVEDEENDIDLDEDKEEDVVEQNYSLMVNKEEDGKSINETNPLIDSKAEDTLNLMGESESNVDYLVESTDRDTKDDDIAQLIESKNEEIINLIDSKSNSIEDKDEESINFVNFENEIPVDSIEIIAQEMINLVESETKKDLEREEEIVCLVESDNEEKPTSIKHEGKEEINLIDSDNEEKLSFINRKLEEHKKKPRIIDEIISSEFSSDIDSDRPASAIPAEYKPRRLSNTQKSTKPILERHKTLPDSPIDPPAEFLTNNFKPKHRVHKQVSIIQLEEHEMSESSEEEYHPRKHHTKNTKVVEKKQALINFDSDQSPGKVSKKIERTDTVIYKGPKPLLLDMSNTDGSSSPTLLSPKILSVSVPVTPSSGDTNHLRLPTVSLLEVVPKTPYMTKSKNPEEQQFKFPDDSRVAEMLYKKFRRSCMFDLIKLIDSRMLAHQHHHSESTRRMKKPHVIKKNNTPSPDDSSHRRHRSRSPEQHHHHHHHHKLHESTTRLHKHDSEISIVDKLHAINNSKLNLNLENPKSNPPIPNSNNLISNLVTNDEISTNQSVIPVTPIVRRQQQQQQQQVQNQQKDTKEQELPPASPANNNVKPQQQQLPIQNSPANTKNPVVPLHRRSSDSDLSITPKDNKSFVKKGRSFRIRSDRSRQSSRPSSRYSSRLMLSAASSGNSLTGSDRSMGGYLKPAGLVRTMNQEALEMLEYPFITMQQYPPGFVLHIGGFVSARSVKLLERISNLEEPEGRDSWWTEIRMEVRSHARALACNVVIGYREETSICDDVCVLSGFGTAAVINLHSTGQDQDNVLITHVQGPMTTSADSTDKLAEPKTPSTKTAPKDAPEQNNIVGTPGSNSNHKPKQRLTSESTEHDSAFTATTGSSASMCGLCHLPYNKSSMNFQVCVSKCAVCRRAKVPDVLFTTVELPENIPMTGRGCFIQATVCKAKKDLRGELNAKEISDCLPFLEYEMHSLLLNKLRMRGMNAIFGLKVQVSIGERLVIGMAVGTAVYLTALPQPSPPQINASGTAWNNEDQLADIQKGLVETVKKNMEFYQLKPLQEVENGKSMSDTDESEDELPELDLGLGMKDVCLLEVDDLEDLDRINLLMDERPPNDFHVVNTEVIPGLEDLEIVRNLQMFTQVSRAKIPVGQPASMPSKYFARLLQTVYFKLRRMVPCALCDLQFKLSMPEPDEIQLSVVGMALGLGEPTKYSKFRRRLLSHSMSKDQVKRTGDDNDLIFSLDEDHAENFSSGGESQTTLNTVTQKTRPRSPLRIKHTTHRHKHVPLKERYGVDITPLSYLPGGRIERYLGNLNFFFIRESNSIRENGGLSGFTHSFVTEVLAIVRAHVTSLGGNAMVAFFMSQCVLLNSPHKNQGQCLINVGGDVVCVSYFANDGKLATGATTNC